MASETAGTFPVDAVRAGETETLVKWLHAGGEIEAPFSLEDWTPLQLLASEGCLPGVISVLDCGARPDGRPLSVLAGVPWQSPLQIAARYGHSAVVSVLAVKGADLDLRDSHGFTALHHCAVQGHRPCCEALLKLGASTSLRTTLPPAVGVGAGCSGGGGGGGGGAPAAGVSAANATVAARTQGVVRGKGGATGLAGWGQSGGGGGHASQGYTAADLAAAAGHREVAALLEAKGNSSSAPDHEKLRAWLAELECGAFYTRFLDAGYDFGYIAEHGLAVDDVDAIGVPTSKLGLRKKLLALYKFPKKKEGGKEEEEEGEKEEESEEEEESGDDSTDESGSEEDGDSSSERGSGDEEEESDEN